MGLEGSSENGEIRGGFRSRLRIRASMIGGWGVKVKKEVLKEEL